MTVVDLHNKRSHHVFDSFSSFAPLPYPVPEHAFQRSPQQLDQTRSLQIASLLGTKRLLLLDFVFAIFVGKYRWRAILLLLPLRKPLFFFLSHDFGAHIAEEPHWHAAFVEDRAEVNGGGESVPFLVSDGIDRHNLRVLSFPVHLFPFLEGAAE